MAGKDHNHVVSIVREKIRLANFEMRILRARSIGEVNLAFDDDDL